MALAVAVLVAGMAATTAIGEAAGPGAGTRTCYDISYLQFPSNFPLDVAFGIVGVTNGLSYSVNPCVAVEYQWAAARPLPPAFYMNTGNPGPISPHWNQGGPRPCLNPGSEND